MDEILVRISPKREGEGVSAGTFGQTPLKSGIDETGSESPISAGAPVDSATKG
jgi:hypothetical protein